MNPADDPFTSLFDAYRAAVLAKDVDAFVALYDPDVVVFDLWSAWRHDGRDAWRAVATDWFASLGTERVAVEFSDIASRVAADLATAQAFVTYRGLAEDGTALRAMVNRLTWTVERRAHGWTIVHEHTSAPVDPGTARAILQR